MRPSSLLSDESPAIRDGPDRRAYFRAFYAIHHGQRWSTTAWWPVRSKWTHAAASKLGESGEKIRSLRGRTGERDEARQRDRSLDDGVLTTCAGKLIADHNERPKTVHDNSSIFFSNSSVWYPVDRNYWEVINLLFFLFFFLLKRTWNWGNVAILEQKVLDVDVIPAQGVNRANLQLRLGCSIEGTINRWSNWVIFAFGWARLCRNLLHSKCTSPRHR